MKPNKSLQALIVSVVLFIFALSLFLPPLMRVQAETSITYTSEPDEIAIFLNNIAFAQDEIALPGGADVAIVLPPQVFADTVVLRRNDERVANYRIQREADRVTVRWHSDDSDEAVEEITLTYLLAGLGWTPRYDMWLADDSEMVGFDFFAEIANNVFTLDDVDLSLIAGRVDTTQQVDTISQVTPNQYIAGYEDTVAQPAAFSGQVSIQHVYTIGPVSAQPGEVIYRQMTAADLPARRVFLWNAQTDQQVDVIYKIRNETDIPFSEGIVRSYQDELFIGSDFIELTPVGGEGSVTVGTLQDVRVNRSVTRTAISSTVRQDTQYDITLSLTNFGPEAVTIEVADQYPADAIDFTFSQDPERQGGNLFRWEVTLEPGDSQVITYGYQAD
ncbi:MAG: DUF4139 domain-containing protein [Chloroflexi bacterium]|nr:DUF4139 domain-containing protein [Chloroflexota bacterium]